MSTCSTCDDHAWVCENHPHLIWYGMIGNIGDFTDNPTVCECGAPGMPCPHCSEWLFTWGYGHAHPNQFVRISGSFNEARAEMVKLYGTTWAFQYPASDEAELLQHGITEWFQ